MKIASFLSNLNYGYRTISANRALERAIDARNAEAVKNVLNHFPRQANCITLNSRTAAKLDDFETDLYFEAKAALRK